ncbi:MAG: hypothetical protein LBC27_01170 [Spirochaetaceae bacterium]|jgi:hypothetical protein|nr:hypothetical protein [Spirochaetaceae bacterium]
MTGNDNNRKTDAVVWDETAALEFDRIASEIFSPIYPVIAKQIAALTSAGRCGILSNIPARFDKRRIVSG